LPRQAGSTRRAPFDDGAASCFRSRADRDSTLRLHELLGPLPPCRPHVIYEHGARQPEARPDVRPITTHVKKVAQVYVPTAISESQLAFRSRLRISPRILSHITAAK